MISYHEPTSDKKVYDSSMHCNYCGDKLVNNLEYCSDSCKKKDSVWHNEEMV